MAKLLVAPEQATIVWSLRDKMYASLVKEFALLKSNPKDTQSWGRIKESLQQTLPRIAELSYREGCRTVGVNPAALELIQLRRTNNTRVDWLSNEVKNWTLKSLGLEAASKKILGKKRAKNIADYETYLSFYNSSSTAWKRNREVRKEWVLADEHITEDICDENADDGAIETDALFSSGHANPAVHIGCYCKLFLHLPQNLLRQPGFRKEKVRIF